MSVFSTSCIFVFLLLLVANRDCRIIEEETTEKAENCNAHENEPVGEVMERICLMCHELHSHSRPSMRAECRAQCFTTETFRECVKLFSPRRHNRHSRSFRN